MHTIMKSCCNETVHFLINYIKRKVMDVMKNTIITIGRQFGSGGHEIAKAVADALSIPFYDKEIIIEAAKKSGLNENLFKNSDERTVSSFLYSVALGTYSPVNSMAGIPMMTMNETIFQTQAEVIREFAAKGSCIFVGRCADYILEDNPDCRKIYIYADMPYRIERIQKLYNLDAAKAESTIIKTDKKRANFYNYYTGKKWNAVENYDLCVNSGKLGITGTVELILSYLRLQEV